jgi:hypothetical protein
MQRYRSNWNQINEYGRLNKLILARWAWEITNYSLWKQLIKSFWILIKYLKQIFLGLKRKNPL